MRSRRMGLRENDKGSSKVWTSPYGANLILGDASNSCAALAGSQLSGYDISHIICVANGNTARKLEERHAAVQAEGERGAPVVRRRSRQTPETGTTWASWSSPASPATGSASAAAEISEDVDEDASAAAPGHVGTLHDLAHDALLPPQPQKAEREVTTMTLPSSEISTLTLPGNLKDAEAEETALEGADEAESAWEDWLTTSQEAASAAFRRALDVKLASFRIADQLQPDETVNIESEWDEHLRGMTKAVEECEASVSHSSGQALGVRQDRQPERQAAHSSPSAEAAQGASQNAHSSKRAVLVHCEMGYNRSPSLVLAFLVQNGCTLREAYRHVLGGRPTVDPLPPFRRALRSFEYRLTKENTVGDDDWYAMHISELVDVVERRSKPRGEREVQSDSDSDASEPENEQRQDASEPENEKRQERENSQTNALDEAVRMREASIKRLLQDTQ